MLHPSPPYDLVAFLCFGLSFSFRVSSFWVFVFFVHAEFSFVPGVAPALGDCRLGMFLGSILSACVLLARGLFCLLPVFVAPLISNSVMSYFLLVFFLSLCESLTALGVGFSLIIEETVIPACSALLELRTSMLSQIIKCLPTKYKRNEAV